MQESDLDSDWRIGNDKDMSSPKPSCRPVIPPEIEAEMTPSVKAVVEALIDHYEKRIADLESKIQKLTPQNSSLPPSTQHPHAKPKLPKRDGKKRKRGGQTGHSKHQRGLIPVEQCDDVIPLQPDACRRCGTPLTGVDSEPIRHQVWELPEIKPIVTEYQQHRLTCSCCGITTCAADHLEPAIFDHLASATWQLVGDCLIAGRGRRPLGAAIFPRSRVGGLDVACGGLQRLADVIN
jgi:hypothetical protein